MRKLSIELDDERIAHYEKLSGLIADIAESDESPDVKSYKLLERVASQLVDLSLSVEYLWFGLTSVHEMIENMNASSHRTASPQQADLSAQSDAITIRED